MMPKEEYSNFRSTCFGKAKRIVIKVGSNVLTAQQGLNIKAIRRLSGQISELIKQGRQVVIVTSGAMASGMRKIGLAQRPVEIPLRQAIAAVGQPTLMIEYEKAFDFFDKKVAQLLLTSDDLTNRQRYLNVRNTIYTLLDWDVIPIINENDTVSVKEIKFGDNDNLSAMIALLIEADVVINLTDIKGLYEKDPRVYTDAAFIPVVECITKDIENFACGIAGALGTGGMSSKIKAAKKLTTAGIPLLIVGERDNVLIDIFSCKEDGTFFMPSTEKLASRKRWIASTQKPKGEIIIDDGAVIALVKKGSSLLPIGIYNVKGHFKTGDSVRILDKNDSEIAIGLVNYPASDVLSIKGLQTNQIEAKLGSKPYDEVIHRDNLVLLSNQLQQS